MTKLNFYFKRLLKIHHNFQANGLHHLKVLLLYSKYSNDTTLSNIISLGNFSLGRLLMSDYPKYEAMQYGGATPKQVYLQLRNDNVGAIEVLVILKKLFN